MVEMQEENAYNGDKQQKEEPSMYLTTAAQIKEIDRVTIEEGGDRKSVV